LKHGFSTTSPLDENKRVEKYGNRHGALIDVVKDKNSFSISVQTYVRYEK
jgi:hypothetical protein